MTHAYPEKSTIVRASATLRQLGFRLADLVSPTVAARLVRDQWFATPPRMTTAGIPAGARAFSITALGGAVVRGNAWGPRDATAPVVYLMHGWGGRGDQFGGFVEPLVAAGMRVVMFDALGHGDSDAGPHGRLTHGIEFGRALDAVFARFGPAHAVVAHSLGAIATYLTLRHGRLSTERLVLVAPMVDSQDLYDDLQQALGFGQRTRSAFDREVARFTGLPPAEFDARHQASYVEPVPTLVIHDRDDRLTAYDRGAALAEQLGAQLVTTEGLGHRRLLGDESVIGAVVDFLVGNPVPASPTVRRQPDDAARLEALLER